MNMSEYMRKLKEDIGYISLKEQYNREMAKIFNKFESDGMKIPADRDKYVAENWNDMIEEEEKPQDKSWAQLTYEFTQETTFQKF